MEANNKQTNHKSQQRQILRYLRRALKVIVNTTGPKHVTLFTHFFTIYRAYKKETREREDE